MEEQTTEVTVDFAERYGPWALIAGASEGTGASFARHLARAGVNVALCSRRPEPLEQLAEDLRVTTGVEVRTQSVDLTSPNLMEDIETLVAGVDVGLLIYNAGAESGSGNFVERPLGDALHLVDLNCRGPVLLAHRFGKEMAARGRGGIILMSSMSAGAGGAYTAMYSASKAFDRTLAEGLWIELGQVGVHVVGIISGLVDTPAMRHLKFAVGPDAFPLMDADDAAAEAIAALPKGPMWVIGDSNREMAAGYWPTDRGQLALGMSQGTAMLFGYPVPRDPS
jgi:short-subunit dehydrogenase